MPNGQQPQQVVRPQQIRDTLYINFFSEVNTTSVSQLIGFIQQGLKQGKKKFCLFISSTGGNLMSGITAYNFLKSIPNEIIAYNYAYAESAAVLIFCAGSKRYCLPNSRFVLHEITSGGIQGSKKMIEDNLKILDFDIQRYVSIISDATGQSKKKVAKDMSKPVIFDAGKSKDYGLAQEIKDDLPSLESEDSVTISVWPQPQPQR